MGQSAVKTSILTLTSEASQRVELERWRYLKSGTQFVLQPCEGVKVTLRPGWTFKGWFGISQPSITFESKMLSKAYSLVLGRSPECAPIRYRYQQLWQRTERSGYRPSFWEDLSGTHDRDERALGEVPDYIVELIDDFEQHIAPMHSFENEDAFLHSLPPTYRYHGYPLQDELMYLLARCMLNDCNAIERFTSDDSIPLGLKERIADDISLIQAAAPKLIIT
ncbi:hypothetical protein [Celeribacter sp.]|uniref:hypothetical protein n=1 Tax=Celeribacter sp. TaxID=1890673 RepID=UPI003A918CB5